MTAATQLYEYQLACIGGLEDVAADELRARLGSAVKGLRFERGAVGRLHFCYEASPRRLLELDCPTLLQAVAAQAYDVTVGRPGLERVLRCVASLPLEAVGRIARACDPQTDPTRYELSVSVRGAHRFGVAEVRDGAREVLRGNGLQAEGKGGTPLRLGVQVQKRRALVTVQLGPPRPAGDPLHEGWSGPAASSVARLLDLEPEHEVVALPGPATGTAWIGNALGGPENGFVVRLDAHRMPLGDGVAVAVLVAPSMATLEVDLAESARVVAHGGVVACLVPQSEIFAARLHGADLPLEVLAGLPFYVHRRRWGLFLLERLDLLGIDSALA